LTEADPSSAATAPLATLLELGSLARAVVVRVDGADDLARRLEDQGLWPGALVMRLQAAPFGDPILFALHGYRLALRKDEAARVRIVPEASS
jgi:Fe2+ transport system protein FeoA